MVKDIRAHLSQAGIYPTPQRLAISEVLFCRHQHLTADQVQDILRHRGLPVSRATVYNTLNLFVEKQLLKEIFVNPSHTFYDSNIQPHSHFYHVDDDRLEDMDAVQYQNMLPHSLPEGTQLLDMDVIVRVRKASSQPTG